MDHELMDKAMQNFDVCVEKHTYSLKNALYGMINHAHKRGLEDGKQLANKQVEESAIETAYQQGYDKGVAEKSSEIMKKYDEGYRKGLESNCAAMLMGQERWEKKFTDALRTAAGEYKNSVSLSTINRIIETAKSYIDDSNRPEKYNRNEENIRCSTCANWCTNNCVLKCNGIIPSFNWYCADWRKEDG